MRELVRLLKFAALDLFAGLDLRWAPDGLSVNPNNNGIRNLMLRMKVTRLNFTTSASGSETRTWSWRRFVCIRHLKKTLNRRTQDLRCVFGSYTYVGKLVANLLAPIALLLIVYGMGAVVATIGKGQHALVSSKAFRMASFVVFLFCAPRLTQVTQHACQPYPRIIPAENRIWHIWMREIRSFCSG